MALYMVFLYNLIRYITSSIPWHPFNKNDTSSHNMPLVSHSIPHITVVSHGPSPHLWHRDAWCPPVSTRRRSIVPPWQCRIQPGHGTHGMKWRDVVMVRSKVLGTFLYAICRWIYIYISISVYCIHYIYICIWNQSVKWIRSVIKFWNGLYLPHKMSRMTFGNGWKWCVGFDSDVSWPIALLAKGNHPSTWLEHNPPFTTAILSKRNSSSPHMFTVIWIHVWGWVKTYHILHILIYFWGNKHVLTSYFRLRRVPGFLLIAVWRMTCVTGWGPWDRTCTLKIKPAASLMFSNTPLKGAAFGASVEAPELFREKDMETYGNQIISLGFLHVSFIWSTGFPKEHGRLWQEEAGSNPAIRSGLYIVIESSFCCEYPNNPPSY